MSRNIFDETSIGNMKIKNRLFRSATWVGLAKQDGSLTKELCEIYRQLALGGVGTIVTELIDVSEFNTAFGNNMRLSSDVNITQYSELTSMVHEYGAKIIPQLNIDQYAKNKFPHDIVDVNEMTKDDIKDVCQLFIEAAIRANKCDFDAIQLHLAYGWLLYRFLDPSYNKREDEYGGNIKNRSRIVCKIIQGIKKELPNIPICAKFSFYADGNTYNLEECSSICKILYESGLDFIEVLGIHSALERGVINPSCYLNLALSVKKKCDIPIVLTGANRNLEVLEKILNNNGIPYFGVSRPFIREPDLPNKWLSGSKKEADCICCDKCYGTPGKRCIFLS